MVMFIKSKNAVTTKITKKENSAHMIEKYTLLDLEITAENNHNVDIV
jgi:hypothetical protein